MAKRDKEKIEQEAPRETTVELLHSAECWQLEEGKNGSLQITNLDIVVTMEY
jgi:hypothetical protein